MIKKWVMCGFILLFSTGFCWAEPITKAHLIPEFSTIQAGKTMWVALRLDIPKGWHIYGSNPADIGKPTRLTLTLPKEVGILRSSWPNTQKFMFAETEGDGYTGRIYLLTQIKISAAYTGKTLPIAIKADWLVCKTLCIPESVTLQIPISVASYSIPNRHWQIQSNAFIAQITPSEPFSLGLLLAMVGFAFLGGLLLNLMPCVLPVVSLKILSFAQLAQHNRRKLLAHGSAFAGGILVAFWALTATLLSLRLIGEEIGWGFQLQSPIIVVLLSCLFFGISLNLFGVFEAGLSLTTLSSKGAPSYIHSFGSGLLATLVATPCTGPFMGSALGFTLTKPAIVTWIIFTALGIGMALPYVILCAFPALLKRLPKPGNWMIYLRQALGFPIILTVIWLSWVLGQQTNLHTVMGLWMLLTGIGFGLWTMAVLQKSALRYQSGYNVILGILIGGAIILFITTQFTASKPTSALQWEPYSAATLARYQKAQIPILVDATAAWCLTCQVNERLVLSHPKVINALKTHGIRTVKADWTKQDPAITAFLHQFGRIGVPLYVLYPADHKKPPVVLPEILTVSQVLEEIEKIRL